MKGASTVRGGADEKGPSGDTTCSEQAGQGNTTVPRQPPTLPQDVFTTKEIVELTEFTERQLGYWDQQGIIKPSIQSASGSGSRRLYSIDDLLQLNIIRQLKKRGWSTQKIREAITRLRKVIDEPDPLKKALLVDGESTLLALYKTKEGERILFDVLSSGGQQVMGIALEVLIEEARRIVTYSSKDITTAISDK